MRILLLSHYFPPEVNAPANRSFEHARTWVRAGHEVSVITCAPNHPGGRLFPGYRNRFRQEEERDGVRVIRVWTYLTPNAGFARRIANYLVFALLGGLAALRVQRPDVVIATSPQFFCGLAGAVAARLRRLPFVLEVRDLWPESIVALGQLRLRAAIRALEALETALYRSARGVVVNSRSFIPHIAARGVPEERIELVENGIDPALFHPRPRDPKLASRFGLDEGFAVAYLGTLGMAHGLRTVLDTAERLRDEPFHFLLIGDGAEREGLEREILGRGLRQVRILGLRPREEIPRWIATADALLVLLRDLPVFRTVIPSKIFEFLAQERPVVLAAPEGEATRLVGEAKAALVVPPEDPEALARALRRLREDPTTAAALARAGGELVRSRFLREDLAMRMLRFVERAARAGPGGPSAP